MKIIYLNLLLMALLQIWLLTSLMTVIDYIGSTGISNDDVTVANYLTCNGRAIVKVQNFNYTKWKQKTKSK